MRGNAYHAPSGGETSTPSIFESAESIACRRREYSASMAATEASDRSRSEHARTPASWDIEEAVEVEWLWYDDIARTSSFGARAHPSRHPVIAYVFEAAPVTTTRAPCFSQNAAAETCSPPSERKRSYVSSKTS